MTTVSQPTTDTPTPLVAQVRRVADARAGRAVFQQELAAQRQAFEAEHAKLIELERAAASTVDAEEERLRRLAVAAFEETGNKAPAPGVTIRLVKKVDYDPATAFAWAKTSGMALVLDRKAYEKIALATPTPGATVREEAHAAIATDLSAVLEGAK